MHFRCGAIFNDHYIAYLLLNVAVKKFLKSVNNLLHNACECLGRFLRHPVFAALLKELC